MAGTPRKRQRIERRLAEDANLEDLNLEELRSAILTQGMEPITGATKPILVLQLEHLLGIPHQPAPVVQRSLPKHREPVLTREEHRANTRKWAAKKKERAHNRRIARRRSIK